MKLYVRNLGRINEAELDIRPLTVFVGKNNTNKTWVAYSLWALLRNLTWRRAGIGSTRTMGKSLMKLRPDETRKRIDAIVEGEIKRLPPHRFKDGDLVELDAARSFFLRDVEGPVSFALDPQHIGQVLRYDGVARDAQVKLEISPEEFREHEAKIVLGLSYVDGDLRIRWHGDQQDAEISQAIFEGEEVMRSLATDWMRAFAQRFLSLGTLLLLPTEREMLVATYESHEEAEREREFVLMAPTKAYSKYLSSAARRWSRNAPTVMPDVLTLMNERLLGGEIDFVKTVFKPQLVFIPKGGSALPIHAASAVVRSLAGLALYVRYAARRGDTVLIDEPEMNAHPEAQIATIELLALLVNRGVRVILTTHSSYILDHLNNLILAGRLSPKDQDDVMPEFRLGTKESFLKSNDVAAYQFDTNADESQVVIKSIYEPKDVWSEVQWDTFGDPSIYVGNLKMQTLVSKLPNVEQT